MSLKKIEKTLLVKNEENNSIINFDHLAYKSAKIRKQKRKEFELLKVEVESLKEKIKSLEELLMTYINKK